ncbi:MAG: putative porin [Kiritimatiellales bacterium]
MKKWMTVTAAVMIAAMNTQAADADIAELQKQLNALSAKIADLEKQQADKIAEIEKKQMDVPAWVADTKFKGDFRYRYENIEDDGSNAKDRQRVRLRIGAYGTVNDFVDYGVRLATGGANATSANQDVDGGTKKEIRLDQYYVDLHPEMFKGAHLVMGKMPQPWVNRTGLIWDGDLNPEGLALTYKNTYSNGFKLIANAGSFVIDENKGDDLQLWAGQLAGETKLGGAKVTLGVSDFYYQRADSGGAAAGLTTANGNTTGTDFHLMEGFASVGINPGIPVTFNGQYVVNADAATSDDTAYLLGVKVGKAKDKGTWEVGYNWRDTGNDAVPDGFNDSDFAGGTTGSYGHSFWAKYQIAKNLQAGATYLLAKDYSGDNVNTFQADLNFKF